MKIIICCSITAADEVFDIKKKLEAAGHEVEIPEGVKNARLRARTEVSADEKAEDKRRGNLIQGYFNKMKKYDAVLVVNPEKRGVKGYIGGNTLIEMAFAHVLGKKLFAIYPLPEMAYSAEILAMQPLVINGDLSLIR